MQFLCFGVFGAPEIKSRLLHALGKGSTVEPHAHPCFLLSIVPIHNDVVDFRGSVPPPFTTMYYDMIHTGNNQNGYFTCQLVSPKLTLEASVN